MTDVVGTTNEVFEAIGGTEEPVATRAIAELTGRSYNAALQWRNAETFPSNTFVVLSDALARRGKTAPPSLWGMTAAAKTEIAHEHVPS